ncbi:MAG TPA: phosphatase PAP2 family protein [Candidatus Competibacter sp.]|nr:phosphatase PAP2 family protein [Candidatus Competibacter sp.]HUM93575.1 phosphatase PAP2 family protein [Candidatus Competibacter sp.]
MNPSRSARPRRWNPWYWDLPMAALAGMVAIVLLRADETLFLSLNRLSAYTGDGLWANITVLGDALIALTLFLALVRRWPDLVWAGLLAGVLTFLFVHGFKHGLSLPRPASLLSGEQFHIIGRVLLTRSFPSGHAATAAMVVGVIVLHLSDRGRTWLAAPLLALVGLVGLSRVVVGAHWPADVLAGAAGGWLAAVGGMLWARRWPWGASPAGRRWLTLILTACALAALLHYQNGYPQAAAWQRLLASLSLGSMAYQLWTERRENGRANPESGRS